MTVAVDCFCRLAKMAGAGRAARGSAMEKLPGPRAPPLLVPHAHHLLVPHAKLPHLLLLLALRAALPHRGAPRRRTAARARPLGRPSPIPEWMGPLLQRQRARPLERPLPLAPALGAALRPLREPLHRPPALAHDAGPRLPRSSLFADLPRGQGWWTTVKPPRRGRRSDVPAAPQASGSDRPGGTSGRVTTPWASLLAAARWHPGACATAPTLATTTAPTSTRFEMDASGNNVGDFRPRYYAQAPLSASRSLAAGARRPRGWTRRRR